MKKVGEAALGLRGWVRGREPLREMSLDDEACSTSARIAVS